MLVAGERGPEARIGPTRRRKPAADIESRPILAVGPRSPATNIPSSSLLDDSPRTPAERAEPARLVVRTREVPERRADGDVADDPVVHRARVHELTASFADARIRELQRQRHDRRILLLHGEPVRERAAAERHRVDE